LLSSSFFHAAASSLTAEKLCKKRVFLLSHLLSLLLLLNIPSQFILIVSFVTCPELLSSHLGSSEAAAAHWPSKRSGLEHEPWPVAPHSEHLRACSTHSASSSLLLSLCHSLHHLIHHLGQRIGSASAAHTTHTTSLTSHGLREDLLDSATTKELLENVVWVNVLPLVRL